MKKPETPITECQCFIPEILRAGLDSISFDSGEVTLWKGRPNAGKSGILHLIVRQWLESTTGGGVLFAEFDRKPESTLSRMATPYIKTDDGGPKDEDPIRFVEKYKNRIFLLRGISRIGEDFLFEVMGDVVSRNAGKWIVIDSLDGVDGMIWCGKRQDDFARRLVDFARSTGVHIHLTAHDGRGAESISGIVDNVMNIIRDQWDEREDNDPAEGWVTAVPSMGASIEILVEKNGVKEWPGSFHSYNRNAHKN